MTLPSHDSPDKDQLIRDLARIDNPVALGAIARLRARNSRILTTPRNRQTVEHSFRPSSIS